VHRTLIVPNCREFSGHDPISQTWPGIFAVWRRKNEKTESLLSWSWNGNSKIGKFSFIQESLLQNFSFLQQLFLLLFFSSSLLYELSEAQITVLHKFNIYIHLDFTLQFWVFPPKKKKKTNKNKTRKSWLPQANNSPYSRLHRLKTRTPSTFSVLSFYAT